MSTVKFIYPRVCAIIGYRQTSFAKLVRMVSACRGEEWSERHALFVLNNERQGSADLLAGLRQVLGEPAWRYITGETNHFPHGRAPELPAVARVAAAQRGPRRPAGVPAPVPVFDADPFGDEEIP